MINHARILHDGRVLLAAAWVVGSPQLGEVCERGLTWIKPSFLWMMYSCGWGTKPDQETVLAVEIGREGFVWAPRNACLSHYVPAVHGDRAAWKRELRRAPARVQWDPERDLRLAPLSYRSLRLGLAGRRPPATRTSGSWASRT